MKKRFVKIPLLAIMTSLAAAWAGERVVYVTTLTTSYTHIGQDHTLSGLFYQIPGDSVWSFAGRPNNRVYAMDAYAPAKGQILAMASHNGVQQSWDGGKTWKVTSDWRMTEVSSIRFAPNQASKIYAASPYGFYKTSDDGRTWQQYNQGLENPDATFVSAIIMDYSRPQALFISTEDGVYQSLDDGEHWQRIGLEVRHVRTLVQHPQRPEVLFAGTEDHGIYRSENQGRHWQKCDTGILHNTFYSITFDPSHPDTLYAGGFQTGIYQSTDGGKTWKQFFAGLGALDIHSLAVDLENSDLIYAGSMGKGVYVSTDGGRSWQHHGIAGGHVWAVKIINYAR